VRSQIIIPIAIAMFALLFTTLYAMMWVDNVGPYRSLPLVPIGPQW
jgi:hypothetical protein